MNMVQLIRNKKILVVMAHYKNNCLMNKFIEHLNYIIVPDGYELELAVSDNSGDFVLECKTKHKINIHKPLSNLYYLNGCWNSIKKWIMLNSFVPEFIVVANHDIVLEKTFILDILRQNVTDSIAAIAPDVITQDGIKQNPHFSKRPTYFSMAIRVFAFRHRLIYMLMCFNYIVKNKTILFANEIKRIVKPNAGNGQSTARRIYAPHGSIIIFTKTFFEMGGGLQSKSDMYHEEMLVAERARLLGLEILYCPSIKVIHNENAVTGLVSSSLQFTWLYKLSYILMDIFTTGEDDEWKRPDFEKKCINI